MTSTNVTIAQVREITGIDSGLIDDTSMQSIIDNVCARTNEFFNIKTTPTLNVDFISIVDEFSARVKKTPLLSVKKLKQNNSSIELDNIQFNSLGTIRRDFRRYFNNQYTNRMNNMLFVEYYYGWLEEDDTKEMTTSPITKGTDVDITVNDSSDYTVGNWIALKGFDGNQEVAKISSLPDGTTIRVEELVYNHETDTLIEKLIIPKVLDQFILFESGVTAAIQAVGGTYTFATSYNFPEYSVVKGVPYPHFEKVTNSLIEQRDLAKARVESSLITIG